MLTEYVNRRTYIGQLCVEQTKSMARGSLSLIALLNPRDSLRLDGPIPHTLDEGFMCDDWTRRFTGQRTPPCGLRITPLLYNPGSRHISTDPRPVVIR